jgi:iron complex transport system substrate-binding protein
LRYIWLLLLTCLCAQHSLAQVVVRDDAGQLVVLSKPAQRILSLAPHITEILYAAGAGESIVGTVKYSDYPKAATAIPRVGDAQGLDLERILALQPDLIVAWKSGTPMSALEKLKKLGFVVFLSEPRKITDIAANIEHLGQLAGTAIYARKASREFLEQYQELRLRYEKKKKVKVFYQIWDQPLMTINGEHLISKIINLCGGENSFAKLTGLAPTVSPEAVLTADPEVIITGGMGRDKKDWLSFWQQWPELRAVKRNNLFFINPEIIQRQSPRILLGAQKLCEYLDLARKKTGAEHQ